jgi:DNA-directed RNA polymerase specialized sigma24 family protein
MDRQAALARLPDRYRELLTLLDAGWSPLQISAALGLDEAALPALVEVGRAKLASVLDRSAGGDRGEPPV